jgi:hypothetical protein
MVELILNPVATEMAIRPKKVVYPCGSLVLARSGRTTSVLPQCTEMGKFIAGAKAVKLAKQALEDNSQQLIDVDRRRYIPQIAPHRWG